MEQGARLTGLLLAPARRQDFSWVSSIINGSVLVIEARSISHRGGVKPEMDKLHQKILAQTAKPTCTPPSALKITNQYPKHP